MFVALVFLYKLCMKACWREHKTLCGQRKTTSHYASIKFQRFFPCALQKYLKDKGLNSLHFAHKNAQIFVSGHYLFLKAHSFPWASLSKHCLPLGTNTVRRQTSMHYLKPIGAIVHKASWWKFKYIVAKDFCNWENLIKLVRRYRWKFIFVYIYMLVLHGFS